MDPIYDYINYRPQAMKKATDANIISELSPLKKDIVLYKKGFDGFWKSGLYELLKKMKIKQLYLTGCQTDCCVRETAVTGAHLGYDIYVISDCCEANREFGQIAAMRFFGICTRAVITTNELNLYFKN